jgi:hypothetical protein
LRLDNGAEGIIAGGFVPRAVETEEQKTSFAGCVVGVDSESESRFWRARNCGVKLERGMEKLTAHAQ